MWLGWTELLEFFTQLLDSSESQSRERGDTRMTAKHVISIFSKKDSAGFSSAVRPSPVATIERSESVT